MQLKILEYKDIKLRVVFDEGRVFIAYKDIRVAIKIIGRSHLVEKINVINPNCIKHYLVPAFTREGRYNVSFIDIAILDELFEGGGGVRKPLKARFEEFKPFLKSITSIYKKDIEDSKTSNPKKSLIEEKTHKINTQNIARINFDNSSSSNDLIVVEDIEKQKIKTEFILEPICDKVSKYKEFDSNASLINEDLMQNGVSNPISQASNFNLFHIKAWNLIFYFIKQGCIFPLPKSISSLRAN